MALEYIYIYIYGLSRENISAEETEITLACTFTISYIYVKLNVLDEQLLPGTSPKLLSMSILIFPPTPNKRMIVLIAAEINNRRLKDNSEKRENNDYERNRP